MPKINLIRAVHRGATVPTKAPLMATGAILWRGPSAIDGAPIVLVATFESRNIKTGDMIQTWILREDMSPIDAVKTGADYSICGDCLHRGDLLNGAARSCYVSIAQAPHWIWRSLTIDRIYPTVTPDHAGALFTGAKVRVGAYGDPGAIPLHVWRAVLANCQFDTGYSHQWRNIDPGFASFLMASVDCENEANEAQAMGFRTFRARAAAEPLMHGEIACPASHEAGNRTICADCGLCGGSSVKGKNIAIIAHGAAGKVRAFEANRMRAA